MNYDKKMPGNKSQFCLQPQCLKLLVRDTAVKKTVPPNHDLIGK